MDTKKVSRKLLNWYNQNARDLPWRRTSDPYAIWISEVMLQQTRVDTVIPYYQRWLAAFPDLLSLNATGEEEVMRLWEGLGYYRRVKNILKTARILVEEHNAVFPDSISELKKLPGIGDYIAGALGSIALGLDEVALDGNGLRVLARLSEYRNTVNEANGKKELRSLMQALLPAGHAGAFNQAIMDLGSLICTPTNPLCAQCPLQTECLSFKHGTQEIYPLRKKKAPVPHYDVVAAVIRKGDKVLIDKRRADGLLGGLWEFPGGKVEAGEALPAALVREIKEELGVGFEVGEQVGKYKHAYTHFKVTVYVFEGRINGGKPSALAADEISWTAIDELDDYPMGKVDRLISNSLQK